MKISKILFIITSAILIISCKTKKVNIPENEKLSDLLIEVQSKNDKFILTCQEGCAWKTLTFPNKQNLPQGIDEYGMTAKNAENPNSKNSKLNDFKFEIENLGESIKFNGIKGLAWTELKYDCSNIDCSRKIDQFGTAN